MFIYFYYYFFFFIFIFIFTILIFFDSFFFLFFKFCFILFYLYVLYEIEWLIPDILDINDISLSNWLMTMEAVSCLCSCKNKSITDLLCKPIGVHIWSDNFEHNESFLF